MHLHDTLHSALGLMGWALWRKWPGQKASNNFLTTRRNALSTIEKNARPRNTWIKFRGSAIVCHGLCRLTRAKIRWKRPPEFNNPTLQGVPSCGPEKEGCIANKTLGDKGCLVPCTGLYADVTDDSLKAFDQIVSKGRVLYVFFSLSSVHIRFPNAESRASLWSIVGLWPAWI